MNIRRKLAVAAAVALPLGGLVAFGGVQAASAGGPPVLTCPSIQPDPSPAVVGGGGTTWDGGGGPGTSGLYFGAQAGGTFALLAGAAQGATSITINNIAIPGETITSIAGAVGTYAVTSDSTPLAAVSPDVVGIDPPLNLVLPTKPLKAKAAVVVGPTSTSSNRSVGDGVVVATTDLQSATAAFTLGDVGQSVSASWNNLGTYDSVFPADSSVKVAAYISPTEVTLNTAANVSKTGVVITIGDTNQAPATPTAHYDLQLSGCQSSWGAVNGNISPTQFNLVGNATAAGTNSAISLLAPPPALSGSLVYPNLPSGYADQGGTGMSQPSSSVTFSVAKGLHFFIFGGPNGCANCDSYAAGTVTGDYPTTKGAMSIAANGVVVCTLGQLQAMGSGTGPDSGSITMGESALKACDGTNGVTGSVNTVGPAAALSNLITVEADPHASAFGSDGTALQAIFEIQGGPTGANNVL